MLAGGGGNSVGVALHPQLVNSHLPVVDDHAPTDFPAPMVTRHYLLHHARLPLATSVCEPTPVVSWSLFTTTFLILSTFASFSRLGQTSRRRRRIRRNHRVLDCVFQSSELITMLLNEFLQERTLQVLLCNSGPSQRRHFLSK